MDALEPCVGYPEENEYVLAGEHVQIGHKIVAAHWRPKLRIKRGQMVADIFTGKLGLCVFKGQVKKKRGQRCTIKVGKRNFHCLLANCVPVHEAGNFIKDEDDFIFKIVSNNAATSTCQQCYYKPAAADAADKDKTEQNVAEQNVVAPNAADADSYENAEYQEGGPRRSGRLAEPEDDNTTENEQNVAATNAAAAPNAAAADKDDNTTTEQNVAATNAAAAGEDENAEQQEGGPRRSGRLAAAAGSAAAARACNTGEEGAST